MKKSLAIALATLIFAGCHSRPSEPPSASQDDALKALGSTVPATQFDRSFWQREHDANSSAWSEAKRLCEQTMLANYPNCLPVNDIVQADLQKKAKGANKAAEEVEDMFRRGYQYDDVRKEWLPYHDMQAAGCIYSYPKIGQTTWQCPAGTSILKGISDPNFSEGK